MLIYNADYEAISSSLSKEPRWVVGIDFDNAGDIHWFTSHTGTPLPAGATNYTEGVLKMRTLASQTLNPDEGRATIGALAFELVDINEAITTVLQTRLDAGDGQNKRKVYAYKGYSEHTDFDTQFELQATQVISNKVTYDAKSVSYIINCSDAQHLMKKDLFVRAKTNITATVAIDATTINVGNTTDFEMFEHDAGYDDAPSATVGYAKLKKGSDVYEIIRYTGSTATSFTGVTRGVMGTKPLVHDYTAGDEADQQIEVEEYIYLEGPIMKIAYAILTGSLYGQAGKTLPSGWHLGISTDFVATSTFTGIGADVWDTTDPALGYQCRFTGEAIKKQDGKKFFEKELMLLAGCFHTVLSDGQIAVRRMADAGADASTVGTLDASNVSGANGLDNALAELKNLYSVKWNWEDLLGKHTRTNTLVDGNSVATHEEVQTKEYTFNGMYGNRMTVDRIYQRFDALRSMYAGPPLRLSVTTLGTQDHYEVGDTIRVTLDNLRDYTNGSQHTLDRAFMVFGKSVAANTGRPTYKLFGSSQKADAMPAPSVEGLNAVLPDSFYSSGLNAANNIETMALAVDPINGFAVVGGVGILQVDIACTGVAGNVNHTDSIFWYDGDLEIASGVTVTVLNGAQLRAMGYFENKGTITGKGGGHVGATGYTEITVSVPSGADNKVRKGVAGTAGYLGSSKSAGSFIYNRFSFPGTSTNGNHAAMPAIGVEFNGSTLIGIPNDMRGTSGAAGNTVRSAPWTAWQSGGAGGSGGAAVVVISRGFAINLTTGSVDLSGDDGVVGAPAPAPLSGNLIHSGSGAGGLPGGLVVAIDGGANSFTGISKVIAMTGDCPIPSGYAVYTPPPNGGKFIANATILNPVLQGGGAPYEAYSYYTGSRGGDMGTAAVSVTHVIGAQTPQADIPQTTSNDTAPTVVEVTNTPRSAAGNLSTIEITANDAGDSNYSYSTAYYRVQGTTEWTKVDVPASPETTVVVASDGTTYDVETRSVSTAGVESPLGVTASITVSNVISPSAGEPAPSTLTNLRIPNVTGLELFQQGNDTEFTGRDAKIAWRKTALVDYLPLGSEPSGLGLDSGALDQFFQDWRVRIYDGATLLREEAVTDNWYIYTHEKNAEDYKRINTSDGAYRTFTFEVVVRVTFSAEVSTRAARLTVSNPVPALPTNISIRATGTSVYITSTAPADLDGKGMMVWMSTSSGFTRNAATMVFKGPGSSAAIDRLTDGTALAIGTTYYLRLAYFDEFIDPAQQDATNLIESTEYSVIYTGVGTADIAQIIEGKNLIGSTLQAGSIVTKGSFLDAPVSGGATTVPLVNADDFATSGSGWISDSTNQDDAFSWTGKSGDSLTGCTGVLAHAEGAVVIPEAQTMYIDESVGELRFYADRDDGSVENLGSIGIKSIGLDLYVATFGSLNSSYSGVRGVSESNIGVFGNSASHYGVLGQSTSSYGVIGLSTSYRGVYGSSTSSVGVKGASFSNIGVEGTGATYDFYASGSGTNYGPFTGGHDALVKSSELAVLQPGDIVIDGRTFYANGISQTIGTAELCRKEKDPRARGVFTTEVPMDEKDNIPAALADYPRYSSLLKKYKRIAFNALGEGMINVCGANGNIKAGDFIVSSNLPGKGMRQDDDIQRNYTVAQARKAVRFKSPDDVKQVPCIYLRG